MIDPEALRARLEQVAAIGPRFAGTDGERLCREWLERSLGELALTDVALEVFPYLAYEPVSSACSVAGTDASLPCTPLQGTADAVVEGEAVYLGDGAPADVEAAIMRSGPLAGRVVVAQPPNLFEFAARLAGHEPGALVNVASTASGLIGSFSAVLYPPALEPPWAGRVLAFPGVTVEAGAGRRLLSLMTSGSVRVRVEHRARYVERSSSNVVATVPGARSPDEVVIVGAHYDSQLDCPGVWDNGSGLATLLVIAASATESRLARTARFVAFGVEEPALWGSFVHSLREDTSEAVGMVNLDTVGSPVNGPRVLVASPGMEPFAAKAAAEAGWGPFECEHPDDERYFDHTPFADAGVPVACFLQSRIPHPYYHSPGDTIELIDHASMELAARASLATVESLAGAERSALPARHQPKGSGSVSASA